MNTIETLADRTAKELLAATDLIKGSAAQESFLDRRFYHWRRALALQEAGVSRGGA